MNTPDQQAPGQRTPSGWRSFVLLYAAGTALLFVTTCLLKLAFSALS